MTCPQCNGRGWLPDHTTVPYGDTYVRLQEAISCDCVSTGTCPRCDRVSIEHRRALGYTVSYCTECGWEEGDES